MVRTFFLITCLISLFFGVSNVAASTFAMLFSDNSTEEWVLKSEMGGFSNPQSSDPTVTIGSGAAIPLPAYLWEDAVWGTCYWGQISDDPDAANGQSVVWSADSGTVSGSIVDGSIFPMNLSTNLTVIGGTGSNPIISWENDYSDIDHFRIRVFDPLIYTGLDVDEEYNYISGETIHTFDFSTIGFDFDQGKDYTISIEARKYTPLVDVEGLDFVEGESWRSSVVNRSKAYTGYSNPVPEPTTILIFGTGLLGLVGSRLRKKKK